MKQQYIEPKVEIIVVKLCGMIADSDPKAGYDPSKTVTPGGVESRRNNVWDDDEY